MKFEQTRVYGFENAILGIRLPMCRNLEEAKEKSDTTHLAGNFGTFATRFGEDDLRIAKNLIDADKNGGGQPNSKFLRMIHVQVCITAPEYMVRELDTYKIGTVRNSSSQMHKLASTPITMDCFEMGDYTPNFESDRLFGTEISMNDIWETQIEYLEKLRIAYNETKDKRYWKELLRLLPSSWLYTFMFDCDYATLRNIYKWRKNHKLVEWHAFCDWIKTLPCAEELICN